MRVEGIFANSMKYAEIRAIVKLLDSGMKLPDFQSVWDLRLRTVYVAINYFDFTPEEAEYWMDQFEKGN